METDSGAKLGPTGQHLAENVKRLRGRIPVRELSDRLTEIGRPILPSGITKIEQGTRRVDVDDLLALAVVLDVSPLTLLQPPSTVAEDPVQVTGVEDTLSARAAWRWMRTELPLSGADDVRTNLEFQWRAKPRWMDAELGTGIPYTQTDLRRMADEMEG